MTITILAMRSGTRRDGVLPGRQLDAAQGRDYDYEPTRASAVSR
jgi:hypothetical protein